MPDGDRIPIEQRARGRGDARSAARGIAPDGVARLQPGLRRHARTATSPRSSPSAAWRARRTPSACAAFLAARDAAAAAAGRTPARSSSSPCASSAIESSCDETAAAVVADGTRVLSNVVVVAGRLHAPLRRRGPRARVARTTSRTSARGRRRPSPRPASTLADLDGDRRHAGPGPRRLAARRPSQAKAHRLRARQAAGRRQPPRGARRRGRSSSSPRAASYLRSRSSSPAATPSLLRGAGPRRYRLLGAHARRRRRRGLRQGGEAPRPRLSGRSGHRPAVARAPTTARIEFAIARLKDGTPDFSFSGIKTAVLYHVRREGIAARGDRGHRVRRDPRPGGVVPARGRAGAGQAHDGGRDRAAAEDAAARRRRGRQPAPPQGGRAGGRRSSACRW